MKASVVIEGTDRGTGVNYESHPMEASEDGDEQLLE